ncbi:MAG: hypothetical protein HZA94_00025 [Candidatus Vogelbacteria bacterium]|nr:hypothetical protein [Candidatus Vogelbacteria bacterium]
MLIEFYGKGCPHCVDMGLIIARLEKEEGVKIEKYETWHNEENSKKFESYDKGRCGGVPFFINTSNDKFICGEASYEELKAWAKEPASSAGKK